MGAIARFVARKVGLAGKSDLEFCQADMIACHYEDIWTKLPKMKFAKSQEEREELAKEFLTEFLPKWLKPLEAILAKRGNLCRPGNHVRPRLGAGAAGDVLQGHEQCCRA